MSKIEHFCKELTHRQAGFIYGTALALIITTLVVSIVLHQKGILSTSLGNGMTGREVVGLVGGVGGGLSTLFASVVFGYRRKKNEPAPPSQELKERTRTGGSNPQLQDREESQSPPQGS